MKKLFAVFIIFVLTITCGCAAKKPFISDENQTETANHETTDNSNKAQTDSGILTGEEPVKPYYSVKNMGSAKELVGNNLIISICIEDDETTISPQEEADISKRAREAADWLENEAKKRGITARIITGKDDGELVLRYKYSGVIDPGSFSYDDILNIMKEMKMGSYYNRIIKKYGEANMAIALSVNKNGRSEACPGGLSEPPDTMFIDDPNENDFCFLDVCVIYEPSVPDHYVLSHELLHLYGAADLYDYEAYPYGIPPNYNMKFEKCFLMEKYFPNEIMYCGIRPYEIGALTAYLIGWEETVPIKYIYFLYDQ